jgi:hypothetical protein
LKLI